MESEPKQQSLVFHDSPRQPPPHHKPGLISHKQPSPRLTHNYPHSARTVTLDEPSLAADKEQGLGQVPAPVSELLIFQESESEEGDGEGGAGGREFEDYVAQRGQTLGDLQHERKVYPGSFGLIRERQLAELSQPALASANPRFASIGGGGAVERVRRSSQKRFDSKILGQNLFTEEKQTSPIKVQPNKPNSSRLNNAQPPPLSPLPPLQAHSRRLPDPDQHSPQANNTLLGMERDQANFSSLLCLDKEQGDTSELRTEQEAANPWNRVREGALFCGTVTREKGCFLGFRGNRYVLRSKEGQFLLGAEKEWGTINSVYRVGGQEGNFYPESLLFAGQVTGNFGGSRFNLYSPQKQIMATVVYGVGCTCQQARKIQAYVLGTASFEELEGAQEGSDLEELYQVGANSRGKVVRLRSREPIWSSKQRCLVLGFKGKCKAVSVKNSILECENGSQSLLFCKSGDNEFEIEVSDPLSPLVALGIVLSIFDFKLLCQ